MLAIFLKTLPFFALIGTGWLAGRLRLFSAEATAALTRFVFYFALSAMLFGFAAGLDIGALFDARFVLAYLSGSAAVWLLAAGMARSRGAAPAEAAMLAHATMIGNTGFLGVPMLVVLLGAGVQLSILTVIVGHVLICMPYAIAILTTAFSSLDKSLEEAAYDLGETRWSAFRLVTLPLVMPGIISSLLISFTISLDEFIIAFFLAGNQPTLPTYIFSQLRFPKQIPMIMALGTVLVALSIVLLALGEYFRRRGNARMGGNPTGGFL